MLGIFFFAGWMFIQAGLSFEQGPSFGHQKTEASSVFPIPESLGDFSQQVMASAASKSEEKLGTVIRMPS